MEVTSCGQIHTSRSLTVDNTGKYTAEVTYRVETDDPNVDQYEVGLAPGWQMGDYYQFGNSTDTLAKVSNINAKCTAEDGQQWEVTVTFTTGDTTANPTDMAPRVNWSWQQDGARTVTQDVNGSPIVNTAGDPIEDIQIDQYSPVLTITRNESAATYNQALAMSYKNAVNSDPFKIASPGQCMCTGITANYNDAGYYEVTYGFIFKAEGFDENVLQRGFRELKDGKLKTILSNGSPVTEPALLATDGTALPVGGQPVYKKFRIYNRLPFSTLNL